MQKPLVWLRLAVRLLPLFSVPVFFALASVVLFFSGSIYFNYELRWKAPVCTVDVLGTRIAQCAIEGSKISQVRVVVAVGPERGRTDRRPVVVDIEKAEAPPRSLLLRAASFSTSADGPGIFDRYYRTVNYGVVAVSPGDVLRFSASNLDILEQFQLRLLANPRDWPVWVAFAGSVLLSLLAVVFRRTMFKSRYTGWVPYVFVFLFGLIQLSWTV